MFLFLLRCCLLLTWWIPILLAEPERKCPLPWKPGQQNYFFWVSWALCKNRSNGYSFLRACGRHYATHFTWVTSLTPPSVNPTLQIGSWGLEKELDWGQIVKKWYSGDSTQSSPLASRLHTHYCTSHLCIINSSSHASFLHYFQHKWHRPGVMKKEWTLWSNPII